MDGMIFAAFQIQLDEADRPGPITENIIERRDRNIDRADVPGKLGGQIIALAQAAVSRIVADDVEIETAGREANRHVYDLDIADRAVLEAAGKCRYRLDRDDASGRAYGVAYPCRMSADVRPAIDREVARLQYIGVESIDDLLQEIADGRLEAKAEPSVSLWWLQSLPQNVQHHDHPPSRLKTRNLYATARAEVNNRVSGVSDV